jgi:asparagine synthetase B (glutamine-hydrolysing)
MSLTQSKNKDIRTFYNHEFDFDNQHKTTFDDWIFAFKNAVAKRAEDGCFMGLSSGYDSGAMACEMLKQGINFKAYAIFNNENKAVLEARLKLIKDHSAIEELPNKEWQRLYDYLDGKINPVAMKDVASPGVAFMFETAKKEGKSVCICNQGGDETISDYALYPNQSTFKGVFPDKLYEWENFKRGKNEEYINEIEDIAALYGIECRYPYLDVNLVQEYLWLSPELKNAHYKAPTREYLIRNNFPFDEGVKKGFRPSLTTPI